MSKKQQNEIKRNKLSIGEVKTQSRTRTNNKNLHKLRFIKTEFVLQIRSLLR